MKITDEMIDEVCGKCTPEHIKLVAKGFAIGFAPLIIEECAKRAERHATALHGYDKLGYADRIRDLKEST